MNIAIVGAGLMGRLLALSLLRHKQLNNLNITLFDKDNKLAHNSAAYAAAGLLTPLGESLDCEPNIVDMGFESLHLWPLLLDKLGMPNLLQQTGAIMVSHEQDKGDYQRFVRHINNHYSSHTLQTLDRQGLLALEPDIGRSFNQGVYLPQEGQVYNRQLLVALQKAIEQTPSNHDKRSNRCHWLSECQVIDITSSQASKSSTNNNFETVSYLQQGERLSKTFDLVIDCRGTGATPKNNSTPCATLTDLRAVRGELFHLFAPEVNLTRPLRLMHPRYQLYIAPKQKDYYVVGATEIESDDDSPMTVRSAMELLSAAYSVHSGFAEANIVQHISQCRPAFSDNQPKISVQNSLIQVNGLFRHGYLISPVVLEQTLAVINNFVNNTDNNLPYSDLLPVSINQNESLHEYSY
jgi:glycine oxidase